jgi:hypothetical protein
MSENSQQTALPAQRIVLRHTTGPYAGLRQIVGHIGDFKGEFPGLEVEADILTPSKPDLRRHAKCKFIFAYNRFMLYEEVQ